MRNGIIKMMSKFKTEKNFFLGLFAGGTLVLAFFGVNYLLHNYLLRQASDFTSNFFGVARAVTFDSDIVPVAGSSINIGVLADQITSINNLLFFRGQSIGLGSQSTTSTSNIRLELNNGGLRLNNFLDRPDCDNNLRGTLWFTPGSSGPDELAVCYFDSNDQYNWASFQGQ